MTGKGRIRVVVADDSTTVRKYLAAVVESDPAFELVGEAADGQSAIEACLSRKPDVLVLDMLLPKVDGVGVIEHLMAFSPLPIVVVSGVSREVLIQTYRALAAGAVEILEKPFGPEPAWERRFLNMLRVASRIKVISHVKGKLQGRKPREGTAAAAERAAVPAQAKQPYELVAIGASTGGPAAVYEILGHLKKSFPLPILLTIHMGRTLATALAEWLQSHSELVVGFAFDGQPVPPPGHGQVVVAPPDLHMEVSRGKIRLHRGPERNYCRPSVDVLFESVAAEFGSRAIGCLLTGMGRDGAAGLLAMRRAGAATIAQDERSSVVFGMPQAAIELAAAERIVPLSGVAPVLVSLVRGEARVKA